MTQPATLCVFIYRALSIPTLGSMMGMSGSQIPWRITVELGDALISRARSIAATKWLHRNDSDVLVMSDDDFRFTPEGLEAIVALSRDKKCIVSGVTPLKSGEYTAIVPLDDSEAEPWRDANSPAIQIKYAGGLIAYHRSVFERMAETLPLLHQNSPIEPFYPFFMPMIVGDEYLSEDYACHERARLLGIPVWVEPRCPVGHLASNMIVTTANMDRVKNAY